MSREEQIKWLRRLLKLREDPKGDTEIDVALKCAIEALEQEPCDDCVGRQAVLDALDKSKYSKEFCEEHHIDWSINLSMAHIVVNELRPVTLQPCDDAVSRQAVISTIYDNKSDFKNDFAQGFFADKIRALLPFTLQPKMGHWEKRDVRGQRVDCCSVCGLSNGTIYEYNYCQNCGAKMESE